MALILIRGENNSKLINAIADMERHGNLNLITKPKVVDAKFADSIVEGILNSQLKTKSNVATAFFVKEDTTLSIIQIKKIHPPAHVVVVSDEYAAYSKLEYVRFQILLNSGFYKEKKKLERIFFPLKFVHPFLIKNLPEKEDLLL